MRSLRNSTTRRSESGISLERNSSRTLVAEVLFCLCPELVIGLELMVEDGECGRRGIAGHVSEPAAELCRAHSEAALAA